MEAIPASREGGEDHLVLNQQPHLSVPELSYQNTNRGCLCSAHEIARLQFAAVQLHCQRMQYLVRDAGHGCDARKQWDADSVQGAALVKW